MQPTPMPCGRGPHGIGVGCIYAEVRFFGQFRHSWDLEPAHLYYKFTYPGQFFGPKFSGNTDCAASTHCYGVGGKSPPFEGSAKNKQFHQTSPYYSLQGLDFSVW